MVSIVKFWLNGKRYCVNKTIRLSDLIDYFNYADTLLVLEYNKFIYDKSSWKQILISDLDTIEIVTIVGGG